VEAAAQAWGAPDGVGYLAEVGMTGLATTVILYRSHLTQHRGKVAGWQNKVLWALMLAPLLGSIVASTTGSGPVGAACSIGAAAFALLAYVVADRSSAAMRDAASLVDQADETELRAQAAGEDLFTLSGLPGAVPETPTVRTTSQRTPIRTRGSTARASPSPKRSRRSSARTRRASPRARTGLALTPRAALRARTSRSPAQANPRTTPPLNWRPAVFQRVMAARPTSS
jgi:hypothetical protein